MATYTLQAPDGKTYSIQGPDGATQAQVQAEVLRQNPNAGKPQVSTVGDMIRGGVSGLEKGAAGVADLAASFIPGLSTLERATTGSPLTGTPTQPVGNLFQRLATPVDYTPKTVPGQYAKTVGAFAPAAAMPGSLPARVANVFAPALASETAGQVAHRMGASPQVEQAVRTVGALAGSGLASVRVTPSASTATATPTLEGLAQAKSDAYQAVDSAGVQYKPEAVANLAGNIKSDLAGARYDADFHPTVAKVVAKLDGKVADNWSPTISELDDLRKFVGENLSDASPTEARLGDKIKGAIDGFIQTATPDQVTGGSSADAAQLLANARDLNTRYMKVQAVDQALDKAGIQAGRSGSGGNIDNATRARMSRLLDTIPNLTDEENAALRGIVMGGKGQNLLRQVGKLSPQGNGIMAAGNLAAAGLGGPLGAVPGFAGLVAKLAADKITQSKVQGLVSLIASGGKSAKAPPLLSAPRVPLLSAPNPYAGVPAALGAATLATSQPEPN